VYRSFSFNGEINTPLTRIEVALFQTTGDHWGDNKGNYHNPTRQRGIYGDIGKTGNRNPSLTRRVVIAAIAQLQN
jgi:hypothetical protein